MFQNTCDRRPNEVLYSIYTFSALIFILGKPWRHSAI